jgi:hypothetical protein
LVTAYQERSVSNVRIQELTNKYPRDINKLLSDLVGEGLLIPQGTGRGTTYILSDFFEPIDEHNLNILKKNLDENEKNLSVKENISSNKEIFSGNKENNSGNKENNSGNKENNSGNKENISGNSEKQFENENTKVSGNNRGNIVDDNKTYKELIEIARPARENKRLKPEILRNLILSLCCDRFLTLTELSYFLERGRDGLRKNHIKKLVDMNKLELRYPNTPNHRNQAYKTVKDNSKQLNE